MRYLRLGFSQFQSTGVESSQNVTLADPIPFFDSYLGYLTAAAKSQLRMR